jgi:hypothetical protein
VANPADHEPSRADDRGTTLADRRSLMNKPHLVTASLVILAAGCGTVTSSPDADPGPDGHAEPDAATTYTLTVTMTGDGGGTVTSTPDGIGCGATCSMAVDPGTRVTLTAIPDAGTRFDGWSSGGCDGPGPCEITIDADTTIGAGFTRLLRVAIEAPAASCARDAGDAIPTLAARLTARGHVATLVVATDIDSLAELRAYDVLVVAPMGANCAPVQWDVYDPIIDDFLAAGGGVVSTGWLMAGGANLDRAPNLAVAMPTVAGGGYTNNATITPQGTHPISDGLGTFTTQFSNYGATAKPGATSLGTDGAHSAGAAWAVGAGRAVYLAPIYLEDYNTYDAAPLLNGTRPAALEWLLRAIEWAGFKR